MEFWTSDFLESICESPSSGGISEEPDPGAHDLDSFHDVYKPANIEGYQEFYDSISPRTKPHLQTPEKQQLFNDSDAEQDILLNEAVLIRLERVRLQKLLPKKPSIIMSRGSQTEKSCRVRELRKIKYCERRIEERVEGLMEGLLRCHELCGVGLNGGKARLGKDVIRLPWYDS